MTRFAHKQLHHIYICFGLNEYLQMNNEINICIETGHFAGITPCRYVFDPEELIIFKLTKIAT